MKRLLGLLFFLPLLSFSQGFQFGRPLIDTAHVSNISVQGRAGYDTFANIGILDFPSLSHLYAFNLEGINSKLQSSNAVYVYADTIDVTETIVLNNGQSLRGMGIGSTVLRASGCDTVISIRGRGCYLANMTIIGEGPDIDINSDTILPDMPSANISIGIGTQYGVVVDSADGSVIQNIEINNFSADAIYLKKLGFGANVNNSNKYGVLMTGIFAKNNYRGVNFDSSGEYNILTSSSLLYNVIGITDAGGNNVITNNKVMANRIGLHKNGLNSVNNAHGIVAASSFNHSSLAAIYCYKITNGQPFGDILVYGAGVLFDSCAGITWDGGQIGLNSDITWENSWGYANAIRNVVFFSNTSSVIINSGIPPLLEGNTYRNLQDNYPINTQDVKFKRVLNSPNGGMIIYNPASYFSTSNLSNALVIRKGGVLPTNQTGLDFKIKIFSNGNTSEKAIAEYFISVFKSTSTQLNAVTGSLCMIDYSGNLKSSLVRGALDPDGRMCLILGDIGSPFISGQPVVSIEEIRTSGPGGYTVSWVDDWTIEQPSNLTGYTSIFTIPTSKATADSGTVYSITGTANQIIVSTSTGNPVLSTPQNIHTAASPTFAGETLTGPLITNPVSASSLYHQFKINNTNVGIVGSLSAINGGTSTDFGYYTYGANPSRFYTNGLERFTILGSGNIGVGDATPASLFTVGNGDLFQVNSTGYIAAYPGTATAGVGLVWSTANTRFERGTLGVAGGGTGTTTTPSLGTMLIGNGTNYTNANPMPINTITTTGTTVVPSTAIQATYKLDCSGGSATFTFTPAYIGQVVVVKRIDGTGNTCTVQASSGNIDGSPNVTLIAQYESLQLQWDGTNLNKLN